MIRIDQAYTAYFIGDDPAYPGGKAKPVSRGNLTDGTPWRALWFNTILGFFQAIIVDALGTFNVSGEPDKVGASDLLDALKTIMNCAVNPNMDARITQNTQRGAANLALINAASAEIGALWEYVSGLVEEAPADGHVRGRKNNAWVEFEGGGSSLGNSVEAYKFFSKKSIMLTNARRIDRRLRGWDIGLPYLSVASEVYHFDTDILNQNQESSISIGYSAAAPVLVDKNDTNGTIFFDPAVQDVAPYEMFGGSLLGRCSISAGIPKSGSTVEFWVRFTGAGNFSLFRAGRPEEDEIVFHLVRADPPYSEAVPAAGEYSAPEAGDTAYSAAAAGDPEYSGVTLADTAYSIPEADGVLYEAALANGNYLEHTWVNGGHEIVELGSAVIITRNAWFHVAAVFTANALSLFVGTVRFDVERKSGASGSMAFEINEDEDELNIDELTIDRTLAESFEGFRVNSEKRIPYAALDHTEKWAVLEVQDPSKLKTNLFESEQFRAAVRAVISD